MSMLMTRSRRITSGAVRRWASGAGTARFTGAVGTFGPMNRGRWRSGTGSRTGPQAPLWTSRRLGCGWMGRRPAMSWRRDGRCCGRPARQPRRV